MHLEDSGTPAEHLVLLLGRDFLQALRGMRDLFELPSAVEECEPHLRDDALGGIRCAGVCGDVEHDCLGFNGDDANGNAPETGAPRHHAARPAGLALHPGAAVEQAAHPRLAAGPAAAHVPAGYSRTRVQFLHCASPDQSRHCHVFIQGYLSHLGVGI